MIQAFIFVPLSGSIAGTAGREKVAVDLPRAVFPPEHEELVVALGYLGACGEDARAACRARASPCPVASLADLVNLKADVEPDGLEDVLIGRAHGVPAGQRGGVLGHEDGLAAIQAEDRLDVVGVDGGLVSL